MTVDADAAQFAVELAEYPQSPRRLLITADFGGSIRSPTRLWTVELARLAAETGLTISVSRLLQDQQMEQDRARAVLPDLDELAGRPPTSHEVIVARTTQAYTPHLCPHEPTARSGDRNE